MAAHKVDRVVVEKRERVLRLFSGSELLKSYRIALGADPVGTKSEEGDGKTPEGSYQIVGRNPKSKFHFSLRISYPAVKDVESARARGVSPGGDIMIHGIRNGFGWLGSLHRYRDWTQGCIAVTDSEIDEIAELVSDGTRVEILP